MSRSLDSAFEAAIESESAEFVHLLEINSSGGAVRLNTGAVDLVWNSLTWEAVGGQLEIGAVEESGDGAAQGAGLTLSGVDQTILAVLLSTSFRGYSASIWRAHLNRTTGAVIGTPLLMFTGVQLDAYKVEEQRGRTGNTVRISTQLSGLMSVPKVRGIWSNLTSHQHYFSGDTFWQHAASLANKKIYWGTPVPHTVSGGGGRSAHPKAAQPL